MSHTLAARIALGGGGGGYRSCMGGFGHHE